MTKTILCTFDVNAYCDFLIHELKYKVYKLVGNQKYLFDVPHISFFISDFKEEDVMEIYNKFNSFSEEFCGAIWFKLNGLKVYKDDVVTKMNTFVYDINGETAVKLKEEQMKFIKYMNIISKDIIVSSRYKELKDKAFVNNVKKYGYPFMGESYQPHISIGSINKKDYDIVNTAGIIKNVINNKVYFKELDMNMYYKENIGNIPGWNFSTPTAFFKSTLKKYKFINLRWGREDLFWIYTLLANNYKIGYLNKKLYEYRVGYKDRINNRFELLDLRI